MIAVCAAGDPRLGRAGPGRARSLRTSSTGSSRPSLGGHLFGTDQLGRDVFARVLYGGRDSVPAAFLVVAIGATLGTVIGAVAGYGGRVVDEIVMRVTDMVLAFPVLVLAMAVAAALGASLVHGVIALTAVWWPAYVRVCRGHGPGAARARICRRVARGRAPVDGDPVSA